MGGYNEDRVAGGVEPHPLPFPRDFVVVVVVLVIVAVVVAVIIVIIIFFLVVDLPLLPAPDVLPPPPTVMGSVLQDSILGSLRRRRG